MRDLREIRTTNDVDEAILKDAEQVWDGWFIQGSRAEKSLLAARPEREADRANY